MLEEDSLKEEPLKIVVKKKPSTKKPKKKIYIIEQSSSSSDSGYDSEHQRIIEEVKARLHEQRMNR